MNHWKKRLLGAAMGVLLVGASACDGDDYLTDVGVDSNSLEQPRSTSDLEEIITGAYWVIGGSGGFQGVRGNEQMFSAYVTDVGRLHDDLGVVGDSWALDWYDRDFEFHGHSWSERWWKGAYAGILQANQVIDWIGSNGAFPDRNAAWTNRILGEAYFVRAWLHFELQRLYGTPWGATPDNGGPGIILKQELAKSAFDNPGLSTTREVYDLIKADLRKAIELLPERYDPARDPEGYRMRADRMVAHFLAARVYFQTRDSERALEHANLVLDSGRFPLTEDPIEAWNKRAWGDLGKEVVFAYYTDGPQLNWKPPIQARQYGYADGNGRWTLACTGGRCNTSQDLSMSNALMQANGWVDPAVAQRDKRYQQLFVAFEAGKDPRPAYQRLTERRIWAHKWYRSGNGGKENPTTTDRVATLPLMRSAELYLTRAYLRLQRNDVTGAVADLNLVRQRAGIGPYSGSTAKADLERAIEIERMTELAFEGDRLSYLQALGRDIPPGDRGGSPFPWQNARVPIPLSELELNPSIEQ